MLLRSLSLSDMMVDFPFVDLDLLPPVVALGAIFTVGLPCLILILS